MSESKLDLREMIRCAHCRVLICVDKEIIGYQEDGPGEAMRIIKCEECNCENTLSWEPIPSFDLTKTTDEDVRFLS